MSVSADQFVAIALELEGTEERAHFDRRAFRVARNYATLAGDGLSANLKLDPMEQELLCEQLPAACAPVPNKWGDQGWTTVTLAAISADDLRAALQMAWHHALPKKRTRT